MSAQGGHVVTATVDAATVDAAAVADTVVLTRRSLRHVTRSPDTIITTAVLPIAFLLLFVFVFGGAIDLGPDGGPYVDYLLPGILVITIAQSVSYASYRLFQDLQGGIVERLQSMPIARSSVLAAHVVPRSRRRSSRSCSSSRWRSRSGSARGRACPRGSPSQACSCCSR